jgi:hypothetical protein
VEIEGIPGSEDGGLREVVQRRVRCVEGPQDPRLAAIAAREIGPECDAGPTREGGEHARLRSHSPRPNVRRAERSQLVAGLHGVVPGRGPGPEAAPHTVPRLVSDPASVKSTAQAVADVEELDGRSTRGRTCACEVGVPEPLPARRLALEDALLRNHGPARRGLDHGAAASNPGDLGRVEAQADVGSVADAHQPSGAERQLLPTESQREPGSRAIEPHEIEECLLQLQVTHVDRP